MMQNNGDNYHVHKTEVSPCIRRLKSLRCMVKSAEKANFSSHVWIFGKRTAGRIGDLGRPDPARGPYFGDPWCRIWL